MPKQKSRQGRRARIPRVGVVQLAPARESRTPFCAYYGPGGETCSLTSGLKTVWRLPGPPACIYMACPFHYEVVHQMVQAFLTRLVNISP
ncbi:MAG TPA: hypothetical protein VKV29_00200 [Chthonomonas sp.]|jgi:hypothetical protein|uniref:hypothetical protein n=1 Tax=Chthonomonas sp. TaxID=2282153 RepID=UPI002B4B17B0|nr:hypothetical protein [Chthonomonas sp.]HLH78684.1 hypothetical protein [Chthonomonas sp.]